MTETTFPELRDQMFHDAFEQWLIWNKTKIVEVEAVISVGPDKVKITVSVETASKQKGN